MLVFYWMVSAICDKTSGKILTKFSWWTYFGHTITHNFGVAKKEEKKHTQLWLSQNRQNDFNKILLNTITKDPNNRHAIWISSNIQVRQWFVKKIRQHLCELFNFSNSSLSIFMKFREIRQSITQTNVLNKKFKTITVVWK